MVFGRSFGGWLSNQTRVWASVSTVKNLSYSQNRSFLSALSSLLHSNLTISYFLSGTDHNPLSKHAGWKIPSLWNYDKTPPHPIFIDASTCNTIPNAEFVKSREIRIEAIMIRHLSSSIISCFSASQENHASFQNKMKMGAVIIENVMIKMW